MVLYLFMAVFFFIVLLMVGLILLQEGKGGGLAGMASGMDGVMGARNPLRRWTAYFFIAFLVLTVGINKYLYEKSKTPIGKGLEAEEKPAPAPAPTPEVKPAPEKANGTANAPALNAGEPAAEEAPPPPPPANNEAVVPPEEGAGAGGN